MKESRTPVFLTFSESKELLPYYKSMNNLGYTPCDVNLSLNGANQANHPGTVISNLVNFPRNDRPALKDYEASSRLSTGNRGNLWDQSPSILEGSLHQTVSHTKGAFPRWGWKHSGNKILRILLVRVSIVSTEGNGMFWVLLFPKSGKRLYLKATVSNPPLSFDRECIILLHDFINYGNWMLRDLLFY